MNASGVFTASIRGLSAVSRFILFLYLGRYVDPATIGVYGVMTAICALVVQFLGLEFHYFNARAILALEAGRRGRLIKDQFALHVLCYLALIPWLSIVFGIGALEWKYALYFFPLVVVEHLGQEIFRVLVTCFRPVFATVVLFVRTGLWVFVFLWVMEFVDHTAPLEKLLLIWLCFSALSVVLGLGGLRKELFVGTLRVPIDWEWIQDGLKKAFPFLVTTVLFTLLQFLDRFALQYFHGEQAVGIFFLFSSLASFLGIVLTFSVGVFYGPRAIYAYQNFGLDGYQRERRILIRKYLLAGSIVILPAIVGIFIVLNWVGRAEYYENIQVYWILLVANIVMLVADVINFDLYVRGWDKAIMWSAVIGVLVALALQMAFVPHWGIIGAAMATTLSYAALGTIRYLFLRGHAPISA